ncbi:hypothetical protein [Mycobacterium sp.]|uniref:hypothetical protein n=1 Tax=Mycobacterium sp. TaxID=1785 RepID=UPI003F9AD44A
MYQDRIDLASFEVWARVQAGEPLTLALCEQVIAERGSTVSAHSVHYQVREWCTEIKQTHRLGQR